MLFFSYFYSTFFEGKDFTYSNWSMETGYSENAGVSTYPRRALFAGAQNSLTLRLYSSKQDIDFTCKRALQGFRVTILFKQIYFLIKENTINL